MNSNRLVSLATVLFAAAALPQAASAQTAVLLDGTVLTQKLPEEPFATEGPIWDVNIPNRQIMVTGKTITIPLTINGVEFLISGSSVLGQDGEAATNIGAANFERISDSHASSIGRLPGTVGVGLGPERFGPTRSIFSTSEAREINLAGPTITRDAGAQALIEDHYFDIIEAVYPSHAAALPPDFLAKAGLRGEDVSSWVYPTTAGGTFKSAGHTYVDPAGNEYLITDIEAVIELSENVSQGIISSAARGRNGVPDSFVIDDLLIVFNQDPRFGADVLGLGATEIPRGSFFSQVVPGSTLVDIIGYMVGEHVLFAQEVLTDMVDVAAGPAIGVDRVRFRDDRDEARFRGVVVLGDGLDLIGIFGGQEILIPRAPDLVTGADSFDARVNLPGLQTLPTFTLELRDANGNVEVSAEFPRLL